MIYLHLLTQSKLFNIIRLQLLTTQVSLPASYQENNSPLPLPQDLPPGEHTVSGPGIKTGMEVPGVLGLQPCGD